MQIWMPYFQPLVFLLLLPLSLYLRRKKGSGHQKNLPPGSVGWPILGENVELSLLGSQKLMTERMQKHSPDAFTTSLFGQKLVVLCGAAGNKFIFTNENKLVTPWLPLSLRKVLFPDFDQLRHQEPKATFHSFKQDMLKPEALRHYMPVMDTLARHHLRHAWKPNSVVKVRQSTKKYTFELACRLFMGVADPERLEKLLEPFSLLTDGMVSLPLNLPGTDFNRAVGAARVVRAELLGIVEERRKELLLTRQGREDIMSRMLLASNEDGTYMMSESKVANMVVCVLVAALYEVSSAITIVTKSLAELPHIYDQVFKEQMEIAKSKGPDELLTEGDVEKMKYTWNVVLEALRMTPPSFGTFRETTTDISFAGFTIPKGWKIMWSPHSCHYNPDYFPDPEKFDPSRFEGSGPAPYTYVPFGGGARMCPGRGYAKLVILVFIHNLVTTFRFEKVFADEKMLFNRLSPAPAHGLPIRLHPHQN
ncbi:beta-amyrin 6-beta-monooxygenase-like [Salvia miltiorrhiza]|uniref:beta-amyrin 6-beta-monooxygenase-like n=1 Tax=Salvia miltiorrhiza TaxID=226208 RepID=UPI0025AB6870|nr:beta-amyrin 6-beta-monooxygenase-like [Salvia miltiorrhiza]